MGLVRERVTWQGCGPQECDGNAFFEGELEPCINGQVGAAGVKPDERVAEAIELVASKRDGDGRWPLETRYPGVMPVEMEEDEGRPSRWITLRALRVVEWYSTRTTDR